MNVRRLGLENLKLRKALAVRDEEMRTVVETMADGIITVDEHGIVLTVNPAIERLFGYVAAEVVGQDINMLMPESGHRPARWPFRTRPGHRRGQRHSQRARDRRSAPGRQHVSD